MSLLQKPLQTIASQLMAQGKGILAADESTESMNARLALYGIKKTPEARRDFRDILLSTPDVEKYISGVILYEETLRDKTKKDIPFTDLLKSKKILAGIKVDKGKMPLPNFAGEEVTEGLDGLSARLHEYFDMGARFTKWRAVVKIGDDTPTDAALVANMHAMARYAALVQQEHMVPMVEPEVLLDGNHTQAQCGEVLRHALEILFGELVAYKVDLSGLILKTSMVLPGKDSGTHAQPLEVARETVAALVETVPKEVAGVVFLSGGQTPTEATENLQAIAKLGGMPWPVTFSYSRALEEPVLTTWKGKITNIAAAQKAFTKRLVLNSQARDGKYAPENERLL